MIISKEEAKVILENGLVASAYISFNYLNRGKVEALETAVDRLIDMTFLTLSTMVIKKIITVDEAIQLLINSNVCYNDFPKK